MKIHILTILFILFCELYVVSQNFNELYDFVDNKQKKSIDKALNEISEAGKLTQEANNYYNEALSLQSNYELDEKTLQKKLAKAEQNAITLQIKADKLYASAYEGLYGVCRDLLNQSTVSYGDTDNLKNSASEMMNEAKKKRDEAKNNKNIYEQAELLNDAAGLEAAAIDNLIVAIQIQNGVAPAQPTQTYTEEPYTEEYSETGTTTAYEIPRNYDYAYSVQQKSENLAIDQDKIDKYNQYVNDPSVPDPIVINRSGIMGVDDVSVDHARNIMHDYHYGSDYTFSEQYAYTPVTQSVIEDSVSQLALLDQEAEMSAYEAKSDTDLDTYTASGETSITESYDDSRYAFDLSSLPQSDNVSFMVQVAASRIPLNRTQLWAIFPGNFTVEVVKEDGWYKYRVTGFRLYTDANRVALESGVRDAWVLSYLQENQINLVQAREMTRVLETDVKRYGHSAIRNQTDFYVQVVASKIRLDENQISQFCGIAGLCREIIEEGWFKYQIYAGNDYRKAVNLKNQLSGDSFIVAYERGSKIKLTKVTRKNK